MNYKNVFLLCLASIAIGCPCLQLGFIKASVKNTHLSSRCDQKKPVLEESTRHVTQLRSHQNSSTDLFNHLQQQIAKTNESITIFNTSKFSFAIKYDAFISSGKKNNTLIKNVAINENKSIILVGASFLAKIQIKINNPLQKWSPLKEIIKPVVDFSKIKPSSFTFAISANGLINSSVVVLQERYNMRGNQKLITKTIGQFAVYNLQNNFGQFIGSRFGQALIGLIVGIVVFVWSCEGIVGSIRYTMMEGQREERAVQQAMMVAQRDERAAQQSIATEEAKSISISREQREWEGKIKSMVDENESVKAQIVAVDRKTETIRAKTNALLEEERVAKELSVDRERILAEKKITDEHQVAIAKQKKRLIMLRNQKKRYLDRQNTFKTKILKAKKQIFNTSMHSEFNRVNKSIALLDLEHSTQLTNYLQQEQLQLSTSNASTEVNMFTIGTTNSSPKTIPPLSTQLTEYQLTDELTKVPQFPEQDGEVNRVMAKYKNGEMTHAKYIDRRRMPYLVKQFRTTEDEYNAYDGSRVSHPKNPTINLNEQTSAVDSWRSDSTTQINRAKILIERINILNKNVATELLENSRMRSILNNWFVLRV